MDEDRKRALAVVAAILAAPRLVFLDEKSPNAVRAEILLAQIRRTRKLAGLAKIGIRAGRSLQSGQQQIMALRARELRSAGVRYFTQPGFAPENHTRLFAAIMRGTGTTQILQENNIVPADANANAAIHSPNKCFQQETG